VGRTISKHSTKPVSDNRVSLNVLINIASIKGLKSTVTTFLSLLSKILLATKSFSLSLLLLLHKATRRTINREINQSSREREEMLPRAVSSSSPFFSSPRRRVKSSTASSRSRAKVLPRNVSSSSTEGGGGKGGGSEAASISGKERRRWITPKPRSEEEENGEENVDGKKENQKNERKEDSYLDEALISLFASRLAKFLNEGEEEEEEEEEDFFNEEKRGVDFKRDVANRCVRAVARTASEEEQRMFGLAIIESFIPTKAAKAFGWFLRLFPDWFARRHAAFVTPLILPWLVGDAEVNDVPLEARARESCEESKVPANAFEAVFAGTKSQQEGYKQGVLVKRCRVLEESGCVSVCKNVCKIPTETFFTEKVGLPVTLIPNYETLECQFCYGRVADGTEGEEAGGCYVGCLASGTKSCGVDNNSGSDSSNESGSEL
jgi:hypothetical protein